VSPSETLSEAAVELARKVLTLESSDLRIARIRLTEACDQAREIIDFDHARRAPGANVLTGPWKPRNPDQPLGAA